MRLPFFRTVALAGTTSVLSWLLLRSLASRNDIAAKSVHPPVEHWENEGGALAPQPGQLETSQVPR
jgi:hypothetical protein